MNCRRCGYSDNQKQRSMPQNSYYWGVVIEIISEHTGYPKHEVHEILKNKFLSKIVWLDKKAGKKEMVLVSRSTSDLTTKQFENFLSEVRTWASAELGCYIPEPNEPARSYECNDV